MAEEIAVTTGLLSSESTETSSKFDGRKKPRTEAQKAQFKRMLEVRKDKLILKKNQPPVSSSPAVPEFHPPHLPSSHQEDMSSIKDINPSESNLSANELFKHNTALWTTYLREKDQALEALRKEKRKNWSKGKSSSKRRRNNSDDESDSNDDSEEEDESSDEEKITKRGKKSLNKSIKHILRKELFKVRSQESDTWNPRSRQVEHYSLPYAAGPSMGASIVERPSLAGTLNSPYLPPPTNYNPGPQIPPGFLSQQTGSLTSYSAQPPTARPSRSGGPNQLSSR